MSQSSDSPTQPVLEVMEDLATPAHHIAAWATCCTPNWRFGHYTGGTAGHQFWKMDLEEDAAFRDIWERARPRCEALAGGPLRVLRVYANGHTYGLGGAVHADDLTPGTFTLLYYANPEWKQEWEGETVYYDDAGEVALAVRPRPNRGVFFDSRIPHVGRPPSRTCSALRVTVAWKLLRVEAEPVSGPVVQGAAEPAAEVAEAQAPPPAEPLAPVAQRTYTHRISQEVVKAAVLERLEQLGRSVSIPGFRPGQAPMEKVAERYGETASKDVIRRLAKETVEGATPAGSLVGTTAVTVEENGDVRIDVQAIHLPDLPEPSPSGSFVRLHATAEAAAAAGLEAEEAASLAGLHLRTQVLDWLDAAYRFPIPTRMRDAEAEAIARIGGGVAEDHHAIAERRIRLGLVIAELARRHNLRATGPAELEPVVIAYLLRSASVQDRNATAGELRELAAD